MTRESDCDLLLQGQKEAQPIRLEFVLGSDENLDAAIKALVGIIEKDEASLAENKRMVNRLCVRAGRPTLYDESDLDASAGRGLGNIRPDEYYGQPLASAVKSILSGRRAANLGAATVKEIYDTLVKGGFKFDAKDENAVRGLRQSLTKNSQTFHKLPNGTYGLLEWYPGVKPAKPDEQDDE